MNLAIRLEQIENAFQSSRNALPPVANKIKLLRNTLMFQFNGLTPNRNLGYVQFYHYTRAILYHEALLTGPYDLLVNWFWLNREAMSENNLTGNDFGTTSMPWKQIEEVINLYGMTEYKPFPSYRKIYLYSQKDFFTLFEMFFKTCWIWLDSDRKIIWPHSLKFYMIWFSQQSDRNFVFQNICITIPPRVPISFVSKDILKGSDKKEVGDFQDLIIEQALQLKNYDTYTYEWLPVGFQENQIRLTERFLQTYQNKLPVLLRWFQAESTPQQSSIYSYLPTFYNEAYYPDSVSLMMAPFDLSDLMINLWYRGFPIKVTVLDNWTKKIYDDSASYLSRETFYNYSLLNFPPGPCELVEDSAKITSSSNLTRITQETFWQANYRYLLTPNKEPVDIQDKFFSNQFYQMDQSSDTPVPKMLLSNHPVRHLKETLKETMKQLNIRVDPRDLGTQTVISTLYGIVYQGLSDMYQPRYPETSGQLSPNKIYNFMEILDQAIHPGPRQKIFLTLSLFDYIILPSPLMGYWISRDRSWDGKTLSFSSLVSFGLVSTQLPVQLVGLILSIDPNKIASIAHQFLVTNQGAGSYINLITAQFINFEKMNPTDISRLIETIDKERFLEIIKQRNSKYLGKYFEDDMNLFNRVIEYLYLLNLDDTRNKELAEAIKYLFGQWGIIYSDETKEDPFTYLLDILPTYRLILQRKNIKRMDFPKIDDLDLYQKRKLGKDYTDRELVEATGIRFRKENREEYLKYLFQLYSSPEDQPRWFNVDLSALQLPLNPPNRREDVNLTPWTDIHSNRLLGFGHLKNLQYGVYSADEIEDLLETAMIDPFEVLYPPDAALLGRAKMKKEALLELKKYTKDQGKELKELNQKLDLFFQLIQSNQITRRADQIFQRMTLEQKDWLKNLFFNMLDLGFRARMWKGQATADWSKVTGIEEHLARKGESDPEKVSDFCHNQQTELVKLLGRLYPFKQYDENENEIPDLRTVEEKTFYERLDEWFREARYFEIIGIGEIEITKDKLWDFLGKLTKSAYCVQLASRILIGTPIVYLRKYWKWNPPFDQQLLGPL